MFYEVSSFRSFAFINLSSGLKWNTVDKCGLMLQIATWICFKREEQIQNFRLSLAAFIDPFFHHNIVASLRLFCRYYFVRYPSDLGELVTPLFLREVTRYSERLDNFGLH